MYAGRAAVRRRRQIEMDIERARKNKHASQTYQVVDADQPAILSQVEKEERSAEKKLDSLRKAVEEQEGVLQTVRLQKTILQPTALPQRSQARRLEKLLRKLPAVAAGQTVDLSTVFGSKLHRRGEQAWGEAWNESLGGRPPIKDIFQVSPGDMVDLRNYLRQLIRNSDEGVRMESKSADRRQPLADNKEGFMNFLGVNYDESEKNVQRRPSSVPKLNLSVGRAAGCAARSRLAAIPPEDPHTHTVPGVYKHSHASAPQLPLLPSSPGGSDSDSSGAALYSDV